MLRGLAGKDEVTRVHATLSGTGTPPPVLCAQGIDIKSGGRYIGHKNRTAPKSENVYINLLHKVSQALKKHRFRTN